MPLELNYEALQKDGIKAKDTIDYLRRNNAQGIDFGELEKLPDDASKYQYLSSVNPTFTQQNIKTRTFDTLKNPLTPEQEQERVQKLDSIAQENRDKNIILKDLRRRWDNTTFSKEQNKILDSTIFQDIASGKPYEQLHPAQKHRAAELSRNESNIIYKVLRGADDLVFGNFSINETGDRETYTQEYYKNQQDLVNLALKSRDSYTQEDLDKIKSSRGKLTNLWNFFANDDEIIDDFKEQTIAKFIVPREMETKLEWLKNVSKHTDIVSILSGDTKHRANFLDDVDRIAQNLGFDGVATDGTSHNIYLLKDGLPYKINDGFFENLPTILAANAGSIGGGILGSAVAAKAAAKQIGKGVTTGAARGVFGGYAGVAAGAVVGFGIAAGGMVGSAIGGAVDNIYTNIYLNRKNAADEILRHATQEGLLAGAGDLLARGVAKVWHGGGNKVFSNAGGYFTKTAGKILDYTPVAGFLKRAQEGNKAAAQKLINSSIDEATQANLKELENAFGGALKIGESSKILSPLISKLESKFGQNSYLTKGARALDSALSLKTQKDAQANFIRAIRADETGNLTAFLAEAANASPKMNLALRNILTQTHERLATQLDSFNLPQNTIQEVFNSFERGTKNAYKTALDDVISKIYDDTYKTTINPTNFNAFVKDLQARGVEKEAYKPFINAASKIIYNEKGVTFQNLNDAQKLINSYYKTAKDPNFRDALGNALEKFVRADIKQGFDDIFIQNQAAYAEVKTLFDTALFEYGRMKQTLKLADKLKLRDEARNYLDSINKLNKYFTAQGSEGIPNIERLFGALPKDMRAVAEVKFLQDTLESTALEIESGGKIFDTSAFFKKLEGLKDSFASHAAKDFIDIAQDFHTLFRNDAQIAQALRKTTSDKIGSSIATSISGAAQFQITKMLFENIVRLMPYIPFAKQLNEKIQGAALRFHLKKALSSALSVDEFKMNFRAKSLKANFTSDTQALTRQILGEVENAKDEMLSAESTPFRHIEPQGEISKTLDSSAARLDSTPTQPLAEFGENFAEFYHKPQQAIAKLLQEKRGQVAGAFHKEGLGDIDLVWGDSQMGLQHILARRSEDFINQGLSKNEAEKKSLEFVETIPQIIENGKVDIKNTRAFIEDAQSKSIVSLNYNGEDRKWLLTAYNKDNALNPTDSHRAKLNTNTSSETRISGEVSGNSTPKIFKMQDVKMDSVDDFKHYSNMVGINFADEKLASDAFKFMRLVGNVINC